MTEKEEVFEYLDNHALDNVFGLPQAVKDKFGISYEDALDFVTEWMEEKGNA